jgi:hypothetical protein
MKVRIFIVLLLIINFTYSQSVRINEVSASNTLFYDEDGDTPDWIELYNYGSSEISLNEWSLSDLLENNNPWTFPEISIKPDDFLLVWASDKDRSDIYFIRTLINQGDTFRYEIANENISSDWITQSYDDDEWGIGNSGFGFSDNDDNTVISNGTIAVFLRKQFTVENADDIDRLILDIDYDDGFVAYINGQEVARSNVSGSPPAFDTTTNIEHEAQMYWGGSPERFIIENVDDLLSDGSNLLSIQVHNISDTSSDMTLIPFLSAFYDTNTNEGIAAPSILNFDSELTTLHSDFKLSASGDSVFLINENGDLVDSLITPSLPSNISYGVSFSEQLVAYENPTPGEPNDPVYYEGVLGIPLTFSHDGGVLDSNINLEITGQDDVEIRYTLDFREPTPNSPLYTGPIPIEENSIVRAKAFKENYISLHSNTRNYFFDINSDHPIIHLVTDDYNLFDNDYGIYAYGDDYSNNYPYFGANFWQDWERPVHISMYEDNNLVFSSNAGIKVFGAYSRAWDQKSFSLFARGQYGNSEFEYQFFDGLDYDNFESLVLRNSGNDWMRTNLRDAAITSLMINSGVDYQSFKTVSSYINNTYWGLYHMREKVSVNFIASKHDVNPNDVTILNDNSELVDGDNQDYIELAAFIEQNYLYDQENYNYVSEQIDIDNFIMYHLSQIYIDNRDYPGNNIKYWKVPGGKWKWILYDTDFGFAGQWWSDWDQNYAHSYNTLEFALEPNGPGWPNPPWSTLFLRKLIQNTEFREKFINRFADEMNTRFLPSNVTNHFLEIHDSMYNEMLNHIDRWIQSEPWVNVNTVYQFVDNMNNFAINRQPFVKQHILDEFNLDNYFGLTLFNDTPDRGFIKVNNNLKIQEQEWGGDYFEDVPVTLKAIPESGYEFSHWSGLIDSTNQEIEINLNDYSEIIAHFNPSEEFNIVINEINYKSSDDFDPGDWIELYNPNEIEIDISGWVLKDSDDSNEYIFPEGTEIDGQGFLVIVRNSDDFTNFYPNTTSFIGEFDFGLSASGDAVRLFDSDLIIHDQVYYESFDPWPVLADGNGYTLELIDPYYDNILPENWSNINFHGSPNEVNSATASISEIDLLYSRVYPNPFVSDLYILFELSSKENTTIQLFDIKGVLVSTIYDGILNSGMHQLKRNFENLRAGIYILKIYTSSGISNTEKLIKF